MVSPLLPVATPYPVAITVHVPNNRSLAAEIPSPDDAAWISKTQGLLEVADGLALPKSVLGRLPKGMIVGRIGDEVRARLGHDGGLTSCGSVDPDARAPRAVLDPLEECLHRRVSSRVRPKTVGMTRSGVNGTQAFGIAEPQRLAPWLRALRLIVREDHAVLYERSKLR